MATNLWTRNELILAFNLYMKLPFGKLDRRTPEVIKLASILGRTSNAVAIRLANFAHVDPYHQKRGIHGMSGGRKQVEPIWNEFIDDKEKLVFESERILAEMENQTLEAKFEPILSDLKNLKGETRLREVKVRVNQSFFRQVVVVNYSGKCAISGIDIPDLLVASHIVPWSKNEEERLNPENGICLSALYDKAFDKGYIGINDKFEILTSSVLKEKENKDYYSRYFSHLAGTRIMSPQKYNPKKEFLEYHRDCIFRG
ncbi:MAG: HNH endonuclease [Bacteroidia bacterium]